MKVTDYIIEFLISKGVTDIFGYPGGVICHLMDSVTKYSEIEAHINYHEQASSFAACAYAQESKGIGVAYATSGPGATNLVTGIANAYFDSIPVLFFTGQVDTYRLKGDLPVRQLGFQETDIISMVDKITKYSVRVDDPIAIKYELEKAYSIAVSGNPGPVLIDLPADVQRSEVDIQNLDSFEKQNPDEEEQCNIQEIVELIRKSKRPCLLVGNGVKICGAKGDLNKLVDRIQIPTVSSMAAFDLLPAENQYNYGFIGANGHRYGNFVLGKSDLILTIGSRLDLKQVGNDREQFATNSRIVRIDIDENSFSNYVRESDINVVSDIKTFIPLLFDSIGDWKCPKEWTDICEDIRKQLRGYDDFDFTQLIRKLGDSIPNHSLITLDVGQNEVWCAQAFDIKDGQSVYMSAGLGAMGYSLPAAIGAYYAGNLPVFSINGDGGIQMNIQELQFLAREQLPIHVVVFNNHSLGMIRGFQEANFDSNYFHTTEKSGYTAPDFSKIAKAYGLDYALITDTDDISGIEWKNKPSLVEIELPHETSLVPNFGRNGAIQDQSPYLSRDKYEELMKK